MINIFFEAGWVEKNTADFLQIQKELVNHDQWIIDGNSSKSLEIRWSKAEVIIFMNYPRWRCYYRVIKRYLFPNTHIDDRAPGCKEVLRWALLKYMWRYNDRIAPTIHFLKAKYPSSTFYAISNNTETRCLIQHLKGDT